MNTCCKQLSNSLKNDCTPVIYKDYVREFYMQLMDYSELMDEMCLNEYSRVVQTLHYCPFCGKKFPESLYDLYFCKIRELGFEPDDEEIPNDFKSDAWWKKLGL